MNRASPSFILAVMAGCSHQGRPEHVAAPTAITFTFTADSMPGGTFPQVSDSTRVLPHGGIRAASDAPLCRDLQSPGDVWNEVQTPIKSRYFKAVALRLPPGFQPAWYSHPRALDEDDPEEFADSTGHWGHMLGSWDRFEGRGPDSRFYGFTLWIGPEEGYPTSSVGGAEVKQVAFSECRVETGLGLLPVALFGVESSEPGLAAFYVVTYARVQPGVYVQAMGTAPDSQSQAALLAAIATIRVVR